MLPQVLPYSKNCLRLRNARCRPRSRPPERPQCARAPRRRGSPAHRHGCAAPAAGSVALTVRPDRTAPRRPRPPPLRSKRPWRCRCRAAAEDTASSRCLPDRRRSPARPLSARRPPGRRQVVADAAARRRHAEQQAKCRRAHTRPRSLAQRVSSVRIQAARARPAPIGGVSRS